MAFVFSSELLARTRLKCIYAFKNAVVGILFLNFISKGSSSRNLTQYDLPPNIHKECILCGGGKVWIILV